MLTRALLLLLAMMSGLSAAQAAGLSRPVAEQVAVSRSVAQLAQESAILCAAKAAHLQPLATADQSQWYLAPLRPVHVPDRAPTPCIYRSERQRE